MSRTSVLLLFLVAVVSPSCSARHNDASGTTSTTDDQSAPRARLTIDHVLPVRDYVGRQPGEFRWTAVPGAETYSIGVYNDIDVLIWRQDEITTTSVKRPEQLTLDAGGYHWSVVAFQGGRPIADSGRSAFAVRTDMQ